MMASNQECVKANLEMVIRRVKILYMLARWVKRTLQRLRLVLFAFRPAVKIEADVARFSYQKLYIAHNFLDKERILDVGSGADPFPKSSILAERYLTPTPHRKAKILTGGKAVVVCDIDYLPFRNLTFDYVTCIHVLEHVDDPIQACRELQRVGKAGFIETPTLMKDALFGWAQGMHKWYVVSISNCLVFFEYNARLLQGIRSLAWHDVIYGPSYHPLQNAFNGNQDLFNILFEWENGFDVTVMRLDGTVQTLDSFFAKRQST
jgi:SAM-dependent methyltransferase